MKIKQKSNIAWELNVDISKTVRAQGFYVFKLHTNTLFGLLQMDGLLEVSAQFALKYFIRGVSTYYTCITVSNCSLLQRKQGYDFISKKPNKYVKK